MFITDNGNLRFQVSLGVQMEASEDAAHGGTAQAGRLSDAHTGPALATELFDAAGQLGGSGSGGTMRPRRKPVLQGGRTTFAEAPDPLDSGLSAELELDRLGRVQLQLSGQHFSCELLSTGKS